MAYFPEQLVSGLPLHTAWRKPERKDSDIFESGDRLFATGLWHGATTAFIAWGALHGFFIIVERIGFKKILDKIGFCVMYTRGLWCCSAG